MNKISVLVPLAPGFEEIEAITFIDVLRRANVEVITAGLSEGVIEASRKTKHLADTVIEKVRNQSFHAVILPGGQPGTNHLKANEVLKEILLRQARADKWIGAICAAPIVLHELGLLAGKKVTSFPGVRDVLSGVHYSEERVVVDGKIITSRGPGTAMEFSLKWVELLCGAGVMAEVAKGLMPKM